MRLYAFDEIGPELELLPLSARRALDHAGCKLSRAAWLTLSPDVRVALAEAGEGATVDAEYVWALTESAAPAPERVPAVGDPPASSPPPEVVAAFGAARPIATALWVTLSPLDRYALAKVGGQSRPERVARAYAEIVGVTAVSTHLGPSGGARMVDVGEKQITARRAEAESAVSMGDEAFARLVASSAAKGDVLGTARLAGIMAAKRTPELIPLCHAIALTRVAVELELDPAHRRVHVRAIVDATDRTGVEMEALVAASTAALTVYDMLKAYDRSMEIGPTRLTSKSGGRTGDYRRGG